MVSFQCHTCGDVVKKPKLDQHHSRCHGGFDCIDCSTTFNTPAEYKTHTSCISEAEKYQKNLYTGPKQGQGPRNGRGHNHQQPRGYGSYSVRGANDTPLGTPPRMSPVTKPVEESGEDVAQAKGVDTGNVEKESKKRKMEEDKGTRENGKSSKKAKSDEKAVDPTSVPLPSPPVKEGEGEEEKKGMTDRKERKEKKERRKKQEEDNMEKVEKVEKKEKKEKKKKKEKKERGEKSSKKEKKEKREPDAVPSESTQVQADGDNDTPKVKKEKKSRKKDKPAEVEATVDVQEGAREAVDRKRRKRNKEKTKVSGDAMEVDTPE